METDKNNQILHVARLYYIDRIPQNRIAEQEGLSKPTVSRLIKKAQDLGYVKIKIEQPQVMTGDLESAIQKKYNLKKVKIIQSPQATPEEIIQKLNESLLEDLKEIVISNSIIGISWNKSLSSLIEAATFTDSIEKENVKVVDLNGSINQIAQPENSTTLLLAIAKIFNAKAYQVCSPLYLDQKKIAKLLREDLEIKKVLDLAAQSDIAILSPESLNCNSLMERDLKNEEIEYLKKKGAVGVFCGHLINRRAKIADNSIDQRIIGINLTAIKRIPEKLFIINKQDQVSILRILLKAKMVDRLFIVDELANEILF